MTFTVTSIFEFVCVSDIENDIFLDELAEKLGNKAYRVGILLGLSPAELDALHFDYKDRGLVVLNTAMLVKWRDRGDCTILELAQAFQKVGLGRIAKQLDPSGISGFINTLLFTMNVVMDIKKHTAHSMHSLDKELYVIYICNVHIYMPFKVQWADHGQMAKYFN